MSLKALQKQIDDALQPYAKPYWQPLSQLARISEEVGEVARLLNHTHGEKPKKPSEPDQNLADELADVLFAVICLANSEKIDLDPAMERAIAKVSNRDKDRYPKKAALG